MPHSAALQVLIAKSDRENGNGWLPVWMHLRDTAEIMELLITERYFSIAEIAELDDDELLRTAKLLAYLHDTGKLTPVFQAKILMALPSLSGMLHKYGVPLPDYSGFLHTSSSPHNRAGEEILLSMGFNPEFTSVIGAHHGMPCVGTYNDGIGDNIENYPINYYGSKNDKAFWERIRSEWVNYTLTETGFEDISHVPVLKKRAQVLLSGLLIMADWLASNTEYFPLYSLECVPEIDEYPENRAVKAWEKIGFTDLWQSDRMSIDIGQFEERFGFRPNTIQQTIIDKIQQCEAPGIFILEAPMGIGKTEAALASAELLGRQRGKTGIFFGLPTQATANGIFPRVRSWAEKQSEESGNLLFSINLVHKNAEFVPAFREIPKNLSDIDFDSGDFDEALTVHSFFSGRKQSCLSDFVIATVDQMLMSALKCKHVMLRHLGLSQKIVIIDECHAYDAYMNCYLDTALAWLSTYGVPVILLSATLPAARREELINAYLNKKSERESGEWASERAYPLLTWTDGPEVKQTVIEYASKKCIIGISRESDESVADIVRAVTDAGGCVGVICNTVVRAQKFAAELCDKNVILYHAQYIMPDRMEKENALLRAIGKSSTPEERRGVVVIGTQVLEQSLDIDFDLLITDLCPMDLLLQRIGRLHRHAGRERPEQYREAKCIVLCANGGDEEYESAAKQIYGKWTLLRANRLLPERVTLPDDIAPLVQSAYADWNPDEESDAEACEEYISHIEIKKQRAQGFLLDPPAERRRANSLHGWLSGAAQDSTAQATVRDGVSSVETLVMLKYENGEIGFLPWQSDGKRFPLGQCPPANDCAVIAQQRIRLPSVLCKAYCVDKTIREIEHMDRQLGHWQSSRYLHGELILLLDENLSASVGGFRLTYSKENGLTYEKEDKT